MSKHDEAVDAEKPNLLDMMSPKELRSYITTLKAQVAEMEKWRGLARQFEHRMNIAFSGMDEDGVSAVKRAEAAEAENVKLREVIHAAVKELSDQGPELMLMIPEIVATLSAVLNTPDTRQDGAADG